MIIIKFLLFYAGIILNVRFANPVTLIFVNCCMGMMMSSLLVRFAYRSHLCKPMQLNHQRTMHSRKKKAMEFIAKGWSALQEVDRVIDVCEIKDQRLLPWLTTAKENFELALETDNYNTQARLWLSKLHHNYHVPGACKAIGTALLTEAAEMGDPDALYELGCRLRTKNKYVDNSLEAFDYIEKAIDQMHPGALYLLGCVYVTGDCVKQDFASALWCFYRASEKGHVGAAIACGSILLRGCELPERVMKFIRKGGSIHNYKGNMVEIDRNPLVLAKKQFEIAAKAGCELGFRWLERIEEEEKRAMASS